MLSLRWLVSASAASSGAQFNTAPRNDQHEPPQVEEMLEISSEELDSTPLRSALELGGREMKTKFEKARHQVKVGTSSYLFWRSFGTLAPSSISWPGATV